MPRHGTLLPLTEERLCLAASAYRSIHVRPRCALHSRHARAMSVGANVLHFFCLIKYQNLILTAPQSQQKHARDSRRPTGTRVCSGPKLLGRQSGTRWESGGPGVADGASATGRPGLRARMHAGSRHAETATQRLRAKKRATGPPLFGAPASQRCLSLFPTRHCIRHSGLVCSLRSTRECDSCNEDSSNFKFNQTYIEFFNIYSFVTDGSEFTSSLPLVSKKKKITSSQSVSFGTFHTPLTTPSKSSSIQI